MIKRKEIGGRYVMRRTRKGGRKGKEEEGTEGE